MFDSVINVCVAAYHAVEAFLGGVAILLVLVLLAYYAVLCWQTLDDRADERRTLRAVREFAGGDVTVREMWLSYNRMKYQRDLCLCGMVIGWGLALAQAVAFAARVW